MIAETIDWQRGQGLVAAVVQDADSGCVLMLGYMSAEALERTQKDGFVPFYSRSRQRLWTKGEGSGHRLELVSIAVMRRGRVARSRPSTRPTCNMVPERVGRVPGTRWPG